MIPERDKPDYCYASGCPLATKGKKFVLGCGDPKTAKLAICLEGPGQEEIAFILTPEIKRKFYETASDCNAELSVRRRDYPTLEHRFLVAGVPVVGRSGFELCQWALPAAGLRRSEIFIDNTLRCLPPKNGDAHYPDGNERKKAEACCRHYDRWNVFRPDVSIISLHPAGIIREPTPLWLQVKNLEKARDFVKQGYRTLVLAGGKAVKWWLGYGENVTKWQGHYEFNDKVAQARRAERLEKYANVSLEGGKKRGKTKTVTTNEDDSGDHGHQNRKGKRRVDITEILLRG